MRDLPMNVADTPDSALAKLIGRKILAFDTETGRVEVGFTITDAFLNMQGVLHGGAFATMLDTACGVAVRSRLGMEKFAGHATLELKTSYLKAGTPGDYRRRGKCNAWVSLSLSPMRRFITVTTNLSPVRAPHLFCARARQIKLGLNKAG